MECSKEIAKFKKENPDSKVKVLYDGKTAIADQKRVCECREFSLYEFKLVNEFGTFKRFKIVKKVFNDAKNEMRFVETHLPVEVAEKLAKGILNEIENA